MHKKRGKFFYVTGIAFAIPLLLLTGCSQGEPDASSKAYYVISEELDVKKTTDKAQEILDAELQKENP